MFHRRRVAGIRHGRNQDLCRMSSRDRGGARVLILLLHRICLIFHWELVLKALRARIRIRILCLKEYKGMGHRIWKLRWGQELAAVVFGWWRWRLVGLALGIDSSRSCNVPGP